jgi:hypothetical protein
MKLFTETILKSIPSLGSTGNMALDKIKVRVKLFNPLGPQKWFITEYDPKTKEAFGFVTLGDPQCAELGYINIQEIEDIKLPLGLKIERDLHFPLTPLNEVMDKINAGKHV